MQEALGDGDTEFRCQHCHGALKLNKRVVANGATPHATHRLRRDSEYCASGWFFLEATDGREARISCEPVR